jgi:hypothetical protein
MPSERREQVFVSSTYLDLKVERQSVIQALLTAGCIPAGMELFVAGNEQKWRLIQRVISECDYYVLVVGGKYGSIDPSTDLSYTEMEYDYADKIGKPVMAFLHGAPGQLTGDQIELDDEPRKRLEAFRQKVEASRLVRYWTTPDALPGEVALSLIEARDQFPAEGWIRASNAATPEMRAELVELRAKVADLNREAESHKLTPFATPEMLAQGDDECTLKLRVTGYLKSELTSGGGIQYGTRRHSWIIPVTTTWNEVLTAIGPTLLDEATEKDIAKVISGFLVNMVNNDDTLLPNGFGKTAESPAVEDQSVGDVLVQFFALGLIARGERQRTASDTNKYWVLTGSGQDQVMMLRAIRRGG